MLGGRYRLDRVLGTGSMGTVWAAYDEVLRRRVAIKEIYVPDGTSRSEAELLRERTLREARAIAQLSHANVITLYDILTLPTGPVIVMEVLAARSLGEVLKEVGLLTVGQAATIGMAVAAGLLAAHQAGITHRDVKPGNVLIGGDGRIKLTDFGIARSSDENPLTATGLLLGSPAYIAPEVASGATAGPPADAWGLGALLYACCEGRPPFDKKAPVATLMSVVNDPVPTPRHAGPLVPIIQGLLVKDPDRRLGLDAARTALRPYADDPVETRLVFTSAGDSAATRATIGGSSLRPAPSLIRPAWADDAPPRDQPAAAPSAATQVDATGSAPLEPARRAGLRSEPGAADLPPPPWAAAGADRLAALPATLPRAMPTAVAAPTGPSRFARWWIAVLVFLAGIALAYFGIRAIAESVSATPASLAASAPAAHVLVDAAASGSH